VKALQEAGEVGQDPQRIGRRHLWLPLALMAGAGGHPRHLREGIQMGDVKGFQAKLAGGRRECLRHEHRKGRRR